jgi:hypothetical protein
LPVRMCMRFGCCRFGREAVALAKAVARTHRGSGCWRAANAPASPSSQRPRRSTGPMSAVCSG